VPAIVAADPLRQAHWRYVCDSLSGMKTLAETDEGAITAYVLARCTLETITQLLDEQVERMGLAAAYGADNKNGVVRNHLLAEQRNARQDVAKFATLLGLTPTSRARIVVPEDGKSGVDRFFA
jgi:P27 family predicted phage terminase small subunit